MIIYRDQIGDSADELWSTVRRTVHNADPLDRLIDCGEIESCVTDDGEHPAILSALQMLTSSAARCFADGSGNLSLPAALETWRPRAGLRATTPEGFAFYHLYPQSYMEAAERFCREIRPHQVTCVGIRSIGTTLSAVVEDSIRRLGLDVARCTTRPHGHPFERKTDFSLAERSFLLSRCGGYFIVIDEGPGISGSSIASVAEAIHDLGISNERVILFPAWETDGAGFRSHRARGIWKRHRRYTGNFDPFRNCRMAEWTGGAWRRALRLRSGLDLPPVYPQHERRKLHDPESSSIHRFVGLGKYGRRRLARAQWLASQGFASGCPVYRDGYLSFPYVEGKPVSTLCEADLKQAASYLAAIRRDFTTITAMPSDEIQVMVETNIREGLGAGWLPGSSWTQSLRKFGETVQVDGRMLRHEWIRNGSQVHKTDALDHGNDHFFPGPTEISWDVAGLVSEFDLDADAKEYLLSAFEILSRDTHARSRAGVFELIYLAYRLGYAHTAIVNAGEPERHGWRREYCRYKEQLKAALARGWIVKEKHAGNIES